MIGFRISLRGVESRSGSGGYETRRDATTQLGKSLAASILSASSIAAAAATLIRLMLLNVIISSGTFLGKNEDRRNYSLSCCRVEIFCGPVFSRNVQSGANQPNKCRNTLVCNFAKLPNLPLPKCGPIFHDL